MKKLRFHLNFFLITILLVTLLVAGCGNNEENDESNFGDVTVPVEVAEAQKDRLKEIFEVSGKLEALSSSNVAPGGQGGKVASVNVEVGDRVQQGQTLISLENEAIRSSVREAEQGVAQAETGLEKARIAYEKAKKDYERNKTLFEQGAIPRAGQNGFEAVEQQYEQAKLEYEKSAPAGLEQAKAGLERARQQLDDTLVKSPLNGIVTGVNVEPGEMASPQAQQPVVSVANINRVVVETDVAEGLVNELKRGDEVDVEVSAVSAETLTGIITSIAPAASQESRAFPVKVQLDNPEHRLKPGMFAKISFVKTYPESIVVPREAVTGSAGEYTAWVVEDGTAQKRNVETGPNNSDFIVVNSGLEEGEKVVTTGAGDLNDGSEVEIKQGGTS